MNNNFIEEFIFAKYKDRSIGNAKKFKGLVKKRFDGVDLDGLYRRIVNYQVEKYNGCLTSDSYDKLPKDVFMRKVKNKERYRRSKLGIEKNTKLRRWSE